MKKRFSIARALLHDPVILLMDEPESGLDQEALGLLDAVVTDKSNPQRTVLMTTHSLDRAIALGQRMAILVNGRVAYQESLESGGAEALKEAYMRHTRAVS
jgi:heme exporter protein A